jgi:hypothetical protein
VPALRISGVAAVCSAERREISTLDTAFMNILRFPPEQYAGIVFLRPIASLCLLRFRLFHFAGLSSQARLGGLHTVRHEPLGYGIRLC